MSAELFRRASEDAEGKLIRKWIVDLENIIEERDARIHELEEEILALKARLRAAEGVPQESYYTPVNAPLEFTETPGTYIPISKPSEAQMRARQALLQIDAKTIKDWEETEQALRRAAQGLLPGEVDYSDSK